MDIEKILPTMVMVGSDLPAYAALLKEVKVAFSDADQATLQAAYADAKVKSDAAHQAALDL